MQMKTSIVTETDNNFILTQTSQLYCLINYLILKIAHDKSLLQFLGSGNWEKYSLLGIGILPPFGQANTASLKWNISLYCSLTSATFLTGNIEVYY